MKIIASGTLKGGTGKTMWLYNTAGILAEKHKVLAIDLDPQCNLTDNANIDVTVQDGPSIRDIFENPHLADPEKLITVAPIAQLPNLDFIASHIRLTAVEMRLTSFPARESILARWINDHEEYLSRYEYILIDTNPSMGIINQNAFMAADSIILVSDVSNKARQGAELFMFLWEEIREAFRMEDNVKALVLNNVDKRMKMAAQIREYYQEDEEFGKLLVKEDIPTRKDLKDTETEYVPINVLMPKSGVCQSFRAVVDELFETGVF
jgi:chromosome partitioning protein